MTKHLDRIAKMQSAAPGRMAGIAAKRAKWSLLAIFGIFLVGAALMLAGIDVPGRAWWTPA